MGVEGGGDAYMIEPSHDGWITDHDRVVGLEFESRSAEVYARD